MPDLEFATTEEIVNELTRRHAGVLVAIYEYQPPREPTHTVWWHGGLPMALGLAHTSAAQVSALIVSRSQEAHGGDSDVDT